MTGKERLTAAMKGEAVDRAPIWLREGFELYNELPPESDFQNGWKQQPIFRDLCDYVRSHIDYLAPWGIGSILNRFLMIPERYIHRDDVRIEGDQMVQSGYIQTRERKLRFRRVWKRNNNNGWLIEPPVRSLADLREVAEIPFELDGEAIAFRRSNWKTAADAVGEWGLPRTGVSSPIVIISGLMTLELFLELSLSHRDYFHELCREITRRELEVVDALFGDRSVETTVNIGGSEQCTPPMMSPQAYDEYVVPYDGQIVDRLHDYGLLVNIHSHGKVRHALACMREMKADSTDPVEPPPAGDLSFAEAQEIAAGEVTLLGNLEYSEIAQSDQKHIRSRVQEIFRNGNRRVILGASAGPNTFIDEKIADNYRALVDAGLEYGS